MQVQQIVPDERAVDLSELISQLTDSRARSAPFRDGTLDFCAQLSTAIFRDSEARRYPELQALAFWMRKAELLRLKRDFEAQSISTTLLVPRGLVFHLPPSNVDTIFIYSWILSALTGNANIIRMSERAAGAALTVCHLFNQVAKDSDPAIARNTAILRYGHQREITAAISAVANVRVIWGGDATVETIRTIPLPPHAQELTFPDRYSLSVLHGANYCGLDEAAKQSLATQFYNDMYWFDQMACSSPRLVIWAGSKSETAEASAAFYDHLAEEIGRKQYSLATGPRLNKLTFAYRAVLDRPIATVREAGPECVVLELEEAMKLDRNHCGGGLLFQARADRLLNIAPWIDRRDQTLTHFGFTLEELRELAVTLNGRGIDRMAPIGQALNFHRFWDGYDLLKEFTRTVHITP
ncbi:MAG TPA: acyl-CoA reductase [Bryobacteraceae bacterium]|jgi:hypothetical protein|nr:acyl-CoA reductase [Bryobacteraceae bacterium]